MVAFPHSLRLLNRVRTRLTVRTLASRAFWMFVALAVLYDVLLLVGKLTGLFPEYFSLWSVPIVPGLALLLAVLWPARPNLHAAARAVDKQAATKDLFLTLLAIENSPSEYKPLVGRDAEARAGSIKPRDVVAYQWEHPTLVAAATLGALFLAAYFVPTLDPFGKVAQAKQGEDARKLLEQTVEQTEVRKSQLARKDLEQENSEEIQQALEKLNKTLATAQPKEQKENQEKLNSHQKEIGEIYRNLKNGELKPLFDQLAQAEQKLGQLANQDKFKEWQKELLQGKSDGLKKELEDIQNKMEQLAKSDDPLAKSELQREIQKQLKALADFNSSKVGSEEMKSTLQRAMQQMESAMQEDKELSEEAMDALKESMELAKQEMQQLEQNARDMMSAEEALEKITMAKKMNAKGELAGEEMGEGMSMEEYREFYAQKMGGRGEGQGEGEGEGEGEGNGGLGGRGFGEGGQAPEDESVATDFVDEVSKSAIQKGKILMTLSEKGLSEAGEVKPEEYRKAVREIRQSLDDVIDQEEIPPGYVDGIKKYFDTLEKK